VAPVNSGFFLEFGQHMAASSRSTVGEALGSKGSPTVGALGFVQ